MKSVSEYASDDGGSPRKPLNGLRSGGRRRRAAALAIGAAVALAALTGTAAVSSAATAPLATKKFTIAFIPGETGDAFFISMHQGVYNEAKALGINLLYEGSATYSPEAQIPVVDAILAKHPSALLISPTDAQALNRPLAAFKKAGIPVITLDSTITDSSELASRITSDNTQGGAAAADALAKLAHDKGQVAIISQIPGISTTDARAAGFEAELKKYPQMSFLGIQYDNGSITTATSDAQSLMLAHPHLVGIFGANDYAASGAGEAVQSGHKTGRVFVAGYDAEPTEVQYLKSGTISLLVVQKPKEEGILGVQYAYDLLSHNGKHFPKFNALANVIATKANITSPRVSQWLYQSQFNS